jgi:hypothetical protein
MANITQINGNLINADTASFATTASYALTGGSSGNPFPYSGSAVITGSLRVTGSMGVTGSLNATSVTSSFTGSLTGALIGTASWATSAVSASYSTTLGANFAQSAPDQVTLRSSNGVALSTVTINNVATASFATSSISASFLPAGTYAITASQASTASRAISSSTLGAALSVSGPSIRLLNSEGVTISTAGNITASLALSASGSLTGSLFGTASFADRATSASRADTASFLNVGTYAITSSWAQSASNAVSASWAPGGGTVFPFVGNAVISGSLRVTGSTSLTGSTVLTGPANSTIFNISSSTFNNIITVSGSGNIGIDMTASTAYTLSVSGSVLTTENFFFADTDKTISGQQGAPMFIRSIGSSLSFNNGTAISTVMGRFQQTTGNFTLQGGPLVTDNGYKFQIWQTGSNAGANGAMWVSGSSVFSGSVNVPVGGVTGSFTGSLIGTSSFSSNTFTNLKTVRFEMGVSSTTVITTGAKGRKTTSFVGTIVGWRLVADQSTTTTVDIWKTNLAIPTVANSITAAAKPALTAAQLSGATTLTGWTTSVADGDVFILNVDSNNNANYISLELDILLTNA